MVKKLKNKIKGLLKGQAGFTLIELIIVIGIMGFLVAMIAPRLAGVMGGASDQICDSNQTRLQDVLAAYTEQYDVMPNGLTNLVIKTGTGHDALKVLGDLKDDGDKGNGLEVFSSDFIDGMKAGYHILTEAEVAELKAMGISKVHNLNLSQAVKEYNGNATKWNEDKIPTTDQRFMDEVSVEDGLRVLMYGKGITAENEYINQADLYGRIILGVGPDSDLVKDGLISKAGMCPNGLKRSDFFAYNNYNIAVPRLESTELPTEIDFEDENTGRTLSKADLTAQKPYQFTTLCPEGDTIAGTAGKWKVKTYTP